MKPLIIIPSYIAKKEHAIVLDTCIKTLQKSAADSDILIVDDASPNIEQANILYDHFGLKYDNVDIERNAENSGFSKTVNVGLKIALEEKRDAVLVNADIEFKEIGWLDIMSWQEADIVGALLLYPNSIVQHAGIYFSPFTRNFDHRFKGAPPTIKRVLEPCECPVTGALQYLRYNVLADVGLYDEEFKLGFEDVDYMIRALKAGHKSLYSPKVKAVHHESLFRNSDSANSKQMKWQKESLVHLLRKWADVDFSDIVPSEVS